VGVGERTVGIAAFPAGARDVGGAGAASGCRPSGHPGASPSDFFYCQVRGTCMSTEARRLGLFSQLTLG
jgi:hypothetical protein